MIYTALRMWRYNVFLPSLNLTFCLYSRFMSHIIYTKFLFSNNITTLSLGRYFCWYAPGMSKVSTYLYSYESISMVDRIPSRVIVGDFYFSLSTSILTFNLSLLFTWMIFTSMIPFRFYSDVRESGSKPLITFISSICLYYLNITYISL